MVSAEEPTRNGWGQWKGIHVNCPNPSAQPYARAHALDLDNPINFCSNVKDQVTSPSRDHLFFVLSPT